MVLQTREEEWAKVWILGGEVGVKHIFGARNVLALQEVSTAGRRIRKGQKIKASRHPLPYTTTTTIHLWGHAETGAGTGTDTGIETDRHIHKI